MHSMYVCMHRYTKMYVCKMYACTCMHVCMHVCMCTCLCMCVCMCNAWVYMSAWMGGHVSSFMCGYMSVCALCGNRRSKLFCHAGKEIRSSLMSGPCGATLAMRACVCVSVFVAAALLLMFVRNALLTVDGEGAKCGLVQRHVVLPWCP